jgi:hypothetical protein
MRVGVQGILHLDGRDVLAARDDHVLLAVRDFEVAGLQRAAVAGVEPPALQRPADVGWSQ